MRLLVLLLITFVPLLCAQQTDAESDEQESTESVESEPAPPPGPSIREEGGVVIIGSRPDSYFEEGTVIEEEVLDEGDSSDEADAPDSTGSDGEQAAAESEEGQEGGPPDGETAIAQDSPEGEVAAEGTDAETESEGPSSSARSVTVFDASGRKIRQPGSQSSRQTESGSENQITLRTISNREVPYLSERETVLRETEKSVEKTVQCYDPNGNPTHREMVREETRKLPDGTVVTTATTYIENINGRMEIVDRVVNRRKEHNGRVESLTTTEKPSINGAFQTVVREESIEEKQGENASTITTVRRVDNGRRPARRRGP